MSLEPSHALRGTQACRGERNQPSDPGGPQPLAILREDKNAETRDCPQAEGAAAGPPRRSSGPRVRFRGRLAGTGVGAALF